MFNQLVTFAGYLDQSQFIKKIALSVGITALLGIASFTLYWPPPSIPAILFAVLTLSSVFRRVKDIFRLSSGVTAAITGLFVISCLVPILGLVCLGLMLILPSDYLNRPKAQSPANSGSEISKATELEKLLNLKERGGLSEEEFDREKAKILAT